MRSWWDALAESVTECHMLCEAVGAQTRGTVRVQRNCERGRRRRRGGHSKAPSRDSNFCVHDAWRCKVLRLPNRAMSWTLLISWTLFLFLKQKLFLSWRLQCQVWAYSPISITPGKFNQEQPHDLNLTKVGKTVIQWEHKSAKMILNWGQHAERKPQTISFIHIKLGKVARCAKLIRHIDYFSGSQCVLVPCLDMVLTSG